MVAQGYLRFAADLEQTWQEAMRTHDGRDPLHALEHVGLSYVRCCSARYATACRPGQPKAAVFPSQA